MMTSLHVIGDLPPPPQSNILATPMPAALLRTLCGEPAKPIFFVSFLIFRPLPYFE